jgi:hypothetical protein
MGYHFVVIDCTLDPYEPPYVNCGRDMRNWVAGDLARHAASPTIVFGHYNMWERPWNAWFEQKPGYAEYAGMGALRNVMENAGNVLASISGHVHANRVEVHNGIHYLDIGATLVGPPSIRYFCVTPDRVISTYEYLSDQVLFDHVVGLCPRCIKCFDPDEVCSFIDGAESDKAFSIPNPLPPAGIEAGGKAVCDDLSLTVGRGLEAVLRSRALGPVEIGLYDVRGRLMGRDFILKEAEELSFDAGDRFPELKTTSGGVYFLRAALAGRAATAKIPVLR